MIHDSKQEEGIIEILEWASKNQRKWQNIVKDIPFTLDQKYRKHMDTLIKYSMYDIIIFLFLIGGDDTNWGNVKDRWMMQKLAEDIKLNNIQQVCQNILNMYDEDNCKRKGNKDNPENTE